ncbi:MAG: preprotein translocase subunit SecE [Actinomycetota bacterium]|nr:preprotein translocase subunit SecE [Actinomycetota bacterium]
MSINRQQRRSSQGEDPADEDGEYEVVSTEVPERRSTTAKTTASRRRATPRQFLHEVNVEMRKVVWPSRAETVNYSTVVFITLVVIMAMIFGLDLAFTKVATFLFT